jgi:hypothetical protein
MLHLTHNKPRFPRTKRFPIAYTRNKSVTSNFISTNAPPRTLTESIAQNLKPSSSQNFANRVGVMSKYFDTPNRTNRDFPERNTVFATHPRRNTSTSNFYFRSRRTPCPLFPNLYPLCIHVRVLSKYSDIPKRTNLDFPERNTRFEAGERKSTLTSFFICHRQRKRRLTSDSTTISIQFEQGERQSQADGHESRNSHRSTISDRLIPSDLPQRPRRLEGEEQ